MIAPVFGGCSCDYSNHCDISSVWMLLISCSEVSSRGSLIASDDAFVCSVISYSEMK